MAQAILDGAGISLPGGNYWVYFYLDKMFMLCLTHFHYLKRERGTHTFLEYRNPQENLHIAYFA